MRVMLSKVPEVTVWFWVIKILCTTVGESFADWINMTLGVGLIPTSLIFTVVLVAVLAWQLRLDRYVPFVYWLTVVVVSVTGTLYTDILTDVQGVPLALSTSVFAAVLALVFGVWYARERTLSIHSITTTPRELFYWLAILVTFALGTAAGDWILELTGWGPGTSVLLPAGLIVAIVIGWRLGANAVLSFWLAYILTRPLGANLGDWLGFPKDQQGLGLGVAITSVIFLSAILATVVYLSITRADVIEKPDDTTHHQESGPRACHARVLRRDRSGHRGSARLGRRPTAHHRGSKRKRIGRLFSRRDAGSRTVGNGEVPARGSDEVPHHHAGHACEGASRRPGGREGSHHGSRNRLGRRSEDPGALGRDRLDGTRRSDRQRADGGTSRPTRPCHRAAGSHHAADLAPVARVEALTAGYLLVGCCTVEHEGARRLTHRLLIRAAPGCARVGVRTL